MDQPLDWDKLAREAVVYGPNGQPVSQQQRDDDEPLLNAEAFTAAATENPPEIRRPTYHVPIEGFTKVALPSVTRAQVRHDSITQTAEEANRVREEARQAQELQAAESFLKTPQGKRIVALEEQLQAYQDKLLLLEVQLERALQKAAPAPKAARGAKAVVSKEANDGD
jgi:hypothetical protein